MYRQQRLHQHLLLCGYLRCSHTSSYSISYTSAYAITNSVTDSVAYTVTDGHTYAIADERTISSPDASAYHRAHTSTHASADACTSLHSRHALLRPALRQLRHSW